MILHQHFEIQNSKTAAVMLCRSFELHFKSEAAVGTRSSWRQITDPFTSWSAAQRPGGLLLQCAGRPAVRFLRPRAGGGGEAGEPGGPRLLQAAGALPHRHGRGEEGRWVEKVPAFLPGLEQEVSLFLLQESFSIRPSLQMKARSWLQPETSDSSSARERLTAFPSWKWEISAATNCWRSSTSTTSARGCPSSVRSPGFSELLAI